MQVMTPSWKRSFACGLLIEAKLLLGLVSFMQCYIIIFSQHVDLINCFLCLIFPVRGMMYYRKALMLQAFLDMAKEDGNFFYILGKKDIHLIPLKFFCKWLICPT